MHSCLAVTTSGLPLGLLDQEITTRATPVAMRSTAELNKVPIETKESFRWLESLRASNFMHEKMTAIQELLLSGAAGKGWPILLKVLI
jgi:hypothetical protein